MSCVRVYLASSLDGFIAGPDDELDWLSGHEGAEDTFTQFFARIGAMLMGRRTYDVLSAFDTWPYGSTPVLVATSRPLPPGRPSVRAATGGITNLVAEAKTLAAGRDVYLDGGGLVRQALDADLVDEMTITVVPMVLGAGRPLFAGVARRHALELLGHRGIGGGLIQLTFRPVR